MSDYAWVSDARTNTNDNVLDEERNNREEERHERVCDPIEHLGARKHTARRYGRYERITYT
jgi:hypothetical protein